MPDKMCEACPNRALVNLNRSLGDEKEALRIEDVGCPWWWTRTEKFYDPQGRETGESRTISCCGIEYLPQFFMSQGHLVQEALETSQSKRNQQTKDMENLTKTISEGIREIAETVSVFSLVRSLGYLSVEKDQLPETSLHSELPQPTSRNPDMESCTSTPLQVLPGQNP